MISPEQAAETGPPPAAARRIPMLVSLSASAIAAIRTMPAHGEQPFPAATASRPASIFLDPEHFALEQRSVFRRLPVPIIPSARLPDPKTVLAHDGYGLALLVTRDKDGAAHVFLNACQHKGSKLVEDEEVHKASRLICPYHSWTYALDGRLIAAAREEAFADFCKADFKLSALPCREYAGMIWAILDRDASPDFSGMTPEFDEDVQKLGVPTAHVYGRHSFDLKANWKLVLEPFMESYHVPRLHAKSIGELFGDVSSVVTKLGLHQRKVAGKAGYQPEMLDLPEENIHKTVTHAYQIFPNGVLVTSPYYISLMILMPRAVDRTWVDYYMLTPNAPDSEKAESVFARSYELILKVFGDEDFRAAQITHAGLASGGLKTLTYGGMETTIPSYYDQLESFFLSNGPPV